MAQASLQFDAQITYTDTAGVRSKRAYAKTISSQKEAYRVELDVAASGTEVVWDPLAWSGFPVSAFKGLVLVSDGQLDIELLTDKGGEVGSEANSFRLEANAPFFLAADDSYANHGASDAFGGTLDQTERIRANNPSSTESVKLTCYIVDDS